MRCRKTFHTVTCLKLHQCHHVDVVKVEGPSTPGSQLVRRVQFFLEQCAPSKIFSFEKWAFSVHFFGKKIICPGRKAPPLAARPGAIGRGGILAIHFVGTCSWARLWGNPGTVKSPQYRLNQTPVFCCSVCDICCSVYLVAFPDRSSCLGLCNPQQLSWPAELSTHAV